MVHPPAGREAFSESFADAMSRVVTPVSVVTTFDDGPRGTTVSAFASLSLTPPMVLVSLDRRSELLSRLTRTQRFGVNVLSRHQSELAIRFARKGSDTFDGIVWHEEEGSPRFDEAAVWLGCRVAGLVEVGDHQIALGDVLCIEVSDAEPLTYHSRAFGTHSSLEETSR